MSYAFDIPEIHATEEEEVGEEGDDLVSDDEKTILSMIPLADMLCVYPCTLHGTPIFKILLRRFLSYSIYHLQLVLTAFGSNADADRNNARLCCDNEELEMRSIKTIARGEEIFNDYGQLPRSDLLRRYGYITENYAQYDVAEITTQEFLPLFRSREAFSGLNLKPLSQEELENRVGQIFGVRSGWDGV
jgi:SET domain-containing protein 6